MCDPTQTNMHTDVPHALVFERRVKLFFILPLLLLRKSPVKDDNKGLNVTIKQRLSLFKSNELPKLVVAYEKDIVSLQQSDKNTAPSYRKSTLYKKTIESIQLGQLKRARQMINSSGCSDPTPPYHHSDGIQIPQKKGCHT